MSDDTATKDLARGTLKVKNSLKVQVGGDHYKKYAIQPIEFCHRNKIGPIESTAIKYIIRHQDKNGAEDIKKAIHVLNILLEIEYSEKDNLI